MRLNQSDIEELKQIYREEFGEELSDDEVWEMGTRLFRLFYILFTPSHQSERREERSTHPARESSEGYP